MEINLHATTVAVICRLLDVKNIPREDHGLFLREYFQKIITLATDLSRTGISEEELQCRLIDWFLKH